MLHIANVPVTGWCGTNAGSGSSCDDDTLSWRARRRSAGGASEQVGETVGRGPVAAGYRVGIDVKGGGDSVVRESRRHDRDRYARGEHLGGHEMAQVMHLGADWLADEYWRAAAAIDVAGTLEVTR
jgi:hypothetical protein